MYKTSVFYIFLKCPAYVHFRGTDVGEFCRSVWPYGEVNLLSSLIPITKYPSDPWVKSEVNKKQHTNCGDKHDNKTHVVNLTFHICFGIHLQK